MHCAAKPKGNAFTCDKIIWKYLCLSFAQAPCSDFFFVQIFPFVPGSAKTVASIVTNFFTQISVVFKMSAKQDEILPTQNGRNRKGYAFLMFLICHKFSRLIYGQQTTWQFSLQMSKSNGYFEILKMFCFGIKIWGWTLDKLCNFLIFA